MKEHPLITRTFNDEQKLLPTIGWVRQWICFENDIDDLELLINRKKKISKKGIKSLDDDPIFITSKVRYIYACYSFALLTHQFLLSIKEAVETLNIKTLMDVGCGTGWFAYWLRKYGVTVTEAVDNFSWKYHRGKRLDFVKKMDGTKAIQTLPKTDMIILSWPNYDSNFATLVWNFLNKGQYLLFIGEWEGGCTGNDSFFQAMDKEGKFIQSIANYNAFFGLHDRAMIIKKEQLSLQIPIYKQKVEEVMNRNIII